MNGFVTNPNLPQGRVSLVAVSGEYGAIIEQINAMGIQTIAVPPCEDLPMPTCSHADMVIHHLGSNRLLVQGYSEQLNTELRQEGFEFALAKNPLKPEYPNDISLNLLSFGKYLLGRIDKADSALLTSTRTTKIIAVKQGYAKCSAAVVDENHVITTDAGIAKALETNGVTAILVSTDGIILDGYNCGFIGGCCGKIDSHTILFTGSLSSLLDGERIRRFIKGCKVKIVELPNKQMLDVGSILPLKISF